MKKLVLLAVITALSFACSLKERTNYPLKDLTGNWYFQIDEEKIGEAQAWYQADYNLQGENILSPFGDWDHLVGHPYDGMAWYFYEFDFNGANDKVALSVKSIDDQAKIWLNGQLVGQHDGANESFKLDVNEIIVKGKNRLTIAINDWGGPGGLLEAIHLITYRYPEDLLKGTFYGAKATVYPEWVEKSILYEVNVRQFTMEGTFNAFSRHIPALKDLGVDIVWLMPIHPIGEKNRKGTLGSYYAVKDFYGINPEFGSLADFKSLIEQIHQAGMYVIIDLVANHTAWDNPMLEKHPEWYTHDESGEIIPPVSDWSDVADLNYDNPELRQYMLEMMQYWIAEIGIDGYRCDVAAMVPMDFWKDAYKVIRSIKPVFMLAEAEAPECHINGFHATYASHMYLLFNNIATGHASVSEIFARLTREYYNYPQHAILMRFTSNHDQNSWHGSEIERYGQKGAQAFAILTVVLPGMPLIYTGQEIGLARRLAFFEKDPIIWRENEFRSFYKTLFAAYHEHPSLHHYQSKLVQLKTSDDEHVFAAAVEKGEDLVIAIINLCDQALECEIDFANYSGKFKEVFSKSRFPVSGGKIKIRFEPWEYRLYVK